MTTKKTVEKKPHAEKPAAKKPAAKKPEAPKKLTAAKKAPAKTSDADATEVAEQTEVSAELGKGGSFIAAVGRRKTAIARVRLIKNGRGTITINGKPFEKYFTVFELRNAVVAPLDIAGQRDAVDVSAKVQGGGIHGQAEAVRHGISRALIQLNPTFRKSLKKLGYLMRDARKKERKKPGLKRARRAPQWSKR